MADTKTRPVDIAVPVYNGLEDLVRCVRSLEAHTDLSRHRVILIDDCSPDSRIREYLKSFCQETDAGGESPASGFLALFNERNLGFSGSVNRGLAFSGRDTILLNSDTAVTEGWVDRLQACACRSERIATVTPLSNAATLASVPHFLKDSPLPEGFSADSFGEFVTRVSLHRYPRIPVAVGFCMYVRQEAYEAAGPFDAETFGRGYGEENDFCFRCGRLGYTHVLCDDTFIYHRGTASFSTAQKRALASEHEKILRERYPAQMEENDRYCREDPDAGIRDNLNLYLPLENGKKNLLYLLHLGFEEEASGRIGGTQLHVRDLCEGARRDFNVFTASRDGSALVLTIFPADGRAEQRPRSLRFPIGGMEPYPVFYDEKMADLLRVILRAFRISLVHVHHTQGLTLDIFRVCHEMNIPVIATLHDYYYACPTTKLLDKEGRFCPLSGKHRPDAGRQENPGAAKSSEHESPGPDSCRRCLAETCGLGQVTGYLERWRRENDKALSLCDRVIFPSQSASDLMLEIFPDLRTKSIVIPHGSGGTKREGAAAPQLQAAGEKIFRTRKMRSFLDSVPSAAGGFQYVNGWAALEGEGSEKTQPYLLVEDRHGTTHLLAMKKTARSDVAASMKDEKYLWSGFHAVFDVPDMPDGRCRIRVLLRFGDRLYTDGQIFRGEYRSIPQGKGVLNAAFLGGVTQAKGSRLLGDVIRSGRDGFRFAVFGQIGDPEVQPERCPDNVCFTGVYDREDAAQLLKVSHTDVACILPVWGETFCYTLSEAWGAGIPVIGTDIGAVGERIRATGAGWLIPPDADEQMLTELLEQIRSCPEELEKKKEAVRHLHLRTVPEMNEDYRKLYGALTEKENQEGQDSLPLTPQERDRIFQGLALADPSVTGSGPWAERNRLLRENALLRSSVEIMENTSSYRFARRLSDAKIPGKETLKKIARRVMT